MTDPVTMRSVLLSMLKAFDGGSIEHVMVTTFNFDPGFFERNVLPLLCGLSIDEIKTKSLDALKRDMFYPLKRMQVVVAYDQGVLNGVSEGGLRYQKIPRYVRNGFFHAKLVVLLGKGGDGTAQGAVMAGSGNMTVSGWADNVEVAGWTLLNQRNTKELKGFYQYLSLSEEFDDKSRRLNAQNVLGSAINHLDAIMSGRKIQNNVPELFLQYPGLKQTLFDRLFSDRKSGDIQIFSPYWGEKTVRTFANHGKAICHPTKGPSGFSFPVAKEDLKNGKSCIEVRAIGGEESFRHAKAYFWDGHAAIGSANCTEQALQTTKNVEAMLLYKGGDFQIPKTVSLKEWNSEVEAEEGIAPTPLGALLIADFSKRCYRLYLDVIDDKRCTQWTLRFGENVLEGSDTTEHEFEFQQNGPVEKVFRLEWEGCDGPGYLTGMIIPEGGNDVELGYRPKRQLSRIFEDIVRHRQTTGKRVGSGGEDKDSDDENDGDESGHKDDDRDDSDVEIERGENFEFDMYGMYQSFYHLRKDIGKVDGLTRGEEKAIEIADTLLEILQAVKDQEVRNDIQRWLIIQECAHLASQLPDQSSVKFFSSLRDELNKNMASRLVNDQQLQRYKIQPEAFLNWVREELGYGQQ